MKSYGCYDLLLKTSAKYPSKVAVREYNGNTNTYTCYTYSEIYGISEYLAQQLRQLNCNKGVIGLISKTNFIVPCMVAAAHKCCTSFMFLDPSKDVSDALEKMDYTLLATVVKDEGNTINNFFKKPEKMIVLYGYCVCFYNFGPPESYTTKLPYLNSFIALTSGSTGAAKKIQVPFQCIKPNIDDLTTLFHITPEDVIYFSTPLTFDPSMVEMLLAFSNGASLLIAPRKVEVLFPDDKVHSITVWQTTPTIFFQFSNAHIKNIIFSPQSTLRILALGGEPLNGVRRLRELKDPENKTKIFTLYGVTEMSCWACVAELNLSKNLNDYEVPLGNCLSETEIVIKMDPENKKPIGKILLTSKTRQCFLLDHGKKGKETNSLKFVDTGDLGELSTNGTIYYRGRHDDMVKRFGHKINLQLIESTVLSCPRVKTCSCVWLPKPKILIVYYTSETLSSQELSDFLRCKLDDKHWPDRIVRVDNMPTNPHGKISKRLLAKLSEKGSSSHSTNPLTLNSFIATFLQEVKNLLNIHGTYDDIKDKTFVAIGGTSFIAVQISNYINASTNTELGKIMLPYLLSPKKTIEQIMAIIEQEINSVELKTRKRKRMETPSSSQKTRSSSGVAKTGSRPGSSPAVAVELILMWTHDTGKCVDASPSLIYVGVNLYVTVGSHSGKIAVIDGLTGTVVGEIKLQTRVEATAQCHPQTGPMPACGIVGGYDGTVVCYTIETCEEIWRTNIGSMVKSKAACSDFSVFVASYDGHIRKLNLMTGKVQASVSISEQPISADLVLAKQDYIMVASLSGVCAGFHIPTTSLVWRATVTSPIFANPVVYSSDKYVVFAEVSGEIHCRTVEKGIKIWQYSAAKGNIFSSLYVRAMSGNNYQMFFGCYDHNLYSININNFQPSLNWKLALDSPIYATPTELAGNMVLAASNNGKLHIISADYAVVVYEFPLPSETFSSPAVYGNYIFVGCRNDLVYSLRYIFNF